MKNRNLLLLLFLAQILYSISDYLGRANMRALPFHISSFIKPWFAAYMGVRLIAVICLFYLFSKIEMGKTRAFFGALSILFASFLGIVFLGETFSLAEYAGMALASLAFVLLSIG